MANKYYAWAPIVHRNNDGSNANLNPGDEVPSSMVDGVGEDTMKLWIHDGVVRTTPYPKDVPAGLSVRTHLLREANKAYEAAQAVGSPVLAPQAENAKAVTPAGEKATTEAPSEASKQ